MSWLSDLLEAAADYSPDCDDELDFDEHVATALALLNPDHPTLPEETP